MAKYHIGVDLHKLVAQVCVLDAHGETVREWRDALPDLTAGRLLVAELAGYGSDSRIAVEALGCNRWFVRECEGMRLSVTVAHAAALGLKKKGRKTDQRDAYEIARRLYLGDIDKNARTYFATDAEYGRRKLMRIRKSQVERHQESANQVRALLNAELLRAPGRKLTSKKTLAWLRALELPSPQMKVALGVLLDDLLSIEGQIEVLDAEIAKLAEEPKVGAMADLPQIGVLSAATMYYELGDVQRFQRSRQVAAYAGLAPRVAQSGVGKAHHGPVDKQHGNSHHRWILCQWAVRLLAFDARAKAWASRRRWPVHNKLRVALARRLLIGVYHMLRTGEAFSLETCLGLPKAA